jgi:hypothetical protein
VLRLELADLRFCLQGEDDRKGAVTEIVTALEVDRFVEVVVVEGRRGKRVVGLFVRGVDKAKSEKRIAQLIGPRTRGRVGGEIVGERKVDYPEELSEELREDGEPLDKDAIRLLRDTSEASKEG